MFVRPPKCFRSKSFPPHPAKSPQPYYHKACRAWALVVGEVLRMFERAVVFQVRCNAGCAEGVIADPGLDTGVGRAPLNHPVGVLLPHRIAREFAGLAGRRAE